MLHAVETFLVLLGGVWLTWQGYNSGEWLQIFMGAWLLRAFLDWVRRWPKTESS